MPKSQITGLRARTQVAGHSQLTRLRAQNVTVAGARSMLIRLRASTTSSTHSMLTGLRAANISTSGPTAVITHDAPVIQGVPRVGPAEVFRLSLETSFGGTFTGYDFTQLSGPTASLDITSDHVDITAPAVKPNTVAYPNDQPWTMVFQGVVEVAGGAQTDTDTITILLEPHLTFAADNSPLFWHLT